MTAWIRLSEPERDRARRRDGDRGTRWRDSPLVRKRDVGTCFSLRVKLVEGFTPRPQAVGKPPLAIGQRRGSPRG